MRWYRIVGVPFVRQDVSDPWSILLRDNCSLKMIYVNNNDALEAYVAINDSSYETLEAELKRANYLFQKSDECLIANKIDILRKIDRINFSNAIYYSIKCDQNGMKALLQHLCNNHGGVCIEINGRHTMSPQLQSQITRIKRFINADVCPFIEDIPNSYNFNIFAFSDDMKCSNSIADKIVSSFEGTERNSCIIESSSFVDEVARIITKTECDHLMSITNLLGDFGIERNNDTLIDNIFNAQVSNNTKSVEIVFGTNFRGDKNIGVSNSELCQHVFIAGGPGSGKSNLLMSIAEQLFSQNISFLIIEPAKYEFHHLSKRIKNLKVWRPETGKFVLNPFYLPEGVETTKYKYSYDTILHSFFTIDSPGSALPGLFKEALDRCCAKYVENPIKPSQFGLAEFITEYRFGYTLNSYDPKNRQQFTAAGINRAKEPITNPFVFDSVESIPINEIVNGFNVLQLECLGTDESRSKFAFVLLTQILALLKEKNSKKLNLVIIMDESHVLLKKTDDCKVSDYFHSMIDEFRSRGISIIIADQSANNIPEGIVNDSYTKVFLGGNDKTGIAQFANKAKLDELAYQNLYNLTAGQGIIICDNNSSGIPFVSENLIKDLKLDEPCEYQNYFLNNNKIITESFSECKSCLYKGKCSFESKISSTKFANSFYILNERLLSDAISVEKTNLEIKEETLSYEEMLTKICEHSLEMNEVIFYCYLKQVFRKFNIDHGNNECFNKYDELINNIIANRYATIYYSTHKELLRKAIAVKDGKIHITKGQDDELLKTICEGAAILSDDKFPFYLERVFREFNSEYGDGVNDDKFNSLINAIIKRQNDYRKNGGKK